MEGERGLKRSEKSGMGLYGAPGGGGGGGGGDL